MSRMFETSEITKLLDVLIGSVEAVGETNEDKRRLDNLKTLIDVTNWCLDGLQFAMASGYGRPEYSMAKISYTAQCALDEYGKWITDVLDERRTDRKTELQKIYCPKCGSSDYIKDLEKDFGVKDSTFKYKCINCNTYIKDEPKTEDDKNIVFFADGFTN